MNEAVILSSAATRLKTIAAILVLAGAFLCPEPIVAFGGGGGDGGEEGSASADPAPGFGGGGGGGGDGGEEGSASANPASGFGGGDGGSSGTELIFALIPNSDHEAAQKLLEWLRAQEEENLEIFAATENPCYSMIVCNGLKPAMVKALIATTLEEKQQATNKRRESEYRAKTNRIAWITALGTVASALVAFAALVLGIRAERRNHRQEARLDNLEADRASKGGV